MDIGSGDWRLEGNEGVVVVVLKPFGSWDAINKEVPNWDVTYWKDNWEIQWLSSIDWISEALYFPPYLSGYSPMCLNSSFLFLSLDGGFILMSLASRNLGLELEIKLCESESSSMLAVKALFR